jgi:predicted aconitase with swiveling domain
MMFATSAERAPQAGGLRPDSRREGSQLEGKLMPIGTMRGTIIALMVLFALAASPASASSGRTETGRFPIEIREVLEPASATCGFPITFEQTGEGKFELFFGAHGELQRAHVLEQATGTVSANGISLRNFSNDNFSTDFTTATQRQTGVVFRDSLPGTGVVLMDRGRLVFNVDPETGETIGPPIFEAGHHPELHGEIGSLCAALTP